MGTVVIRGAHYSVKYGNAVQGPKTKRPACCSIDRPSELAALT
jgi:hypothetical protein